MYLIVGLGNPGAKYDSTRHNMGFELIDYIVRENNYKLDKLKHKAMFTKVNMCGQEVILAKPQTYMNLSGESVYSIMNFYNIPVENLIVVYDDIDLNVGALRIRKFGSAGTHNGMRNIILHLKSDKFPRLRLGIGKPENMPLENYVLSRFQSSEVKDVEDSIIRCAKAIEMILKDGIDNAMNFYNTKGKNGE